MAGINGDCSHELFNGAVLALFKTNTRTRSSVASESSTEECPTVLSPVCMALSKCSRALARVISIIVAVCVSKGIAYSSRSALLYGGPARWGNSIAVSTQLWCIIRIVLRSFSRACPIIIVSALMNRSSVLRAEANVKTALEYDSSVTPENRVFKSLHAQ